MLTALFVIAFFVVMSMLMAYLVMGDTKLVMHMLIVAVVAFVAIMAISYTVVPSAEGLGAATEALN